MAAQDHHVMMINTHSVERNRDNPRLLFDEQSLKTLQESIRIRGIMVPLIVYPKENNKYTEKVKFEIAHSGRLVEKF